MEAYLIDFNETYIEGDTIPGFTIEGITDDDIAVDLTNVGICMQIRDVGGFLYKTLELGTDITLIGTDGIGVSDFKLDNAGSYISDIEFTFAGDVVQTWFKWDFKVVKGVTKKNG